MDSVKKAAKCRAEKGGRLKKEVQATATTVSFCCRRGWGGGVRGLSLGIGGAAVVYSQGWDQAGHGVQMHV